MYMNFTILISEIIQTLFNTIREFQTEITEFKILQIFISNFLQDNNTNSSFISKFEKFLNLFIFSND